MQAILVLGPGSARAGRAAAPGEREVGEAIENTYSGVVADRHAHESVIPCGSLGFAVVALFAIAGAPRSLLLLGETLARA